MTSKLSKILTTITIIILFLPVFLLTMSDEYINNNEKNYKNNNYIEQNDSSKDNIDNHEEDNTRNDTIKDNDNDHGDDNNNGNDDKDDKDANIKYYVDNNYILRPVNSDDNKKVILLTFDDAPQGEHTTEILDILDKHNAKAIFFVNGHYAIKNEDLIMEIYERGHILGNHTWWHENLKEITPEKTKEEIVKVNDYLEEITGERPQYFRPPFGVMSDNAKEIISDESMQSMNWSLGSLDWEYSSPEEYQKVIDQVIDNAFSGANILMHDKEVTALALDEILTKLEDLGYTFQLPTEVITK